MVSYNKGAFVNAYLNPEFSDLDAEILYISPGHRVSGVMLGRGLVMEQSEFQQMIQIGVGQTIFGKIPPQRGKIGY